MQRGNPDEHLRLTLPFVGRQKETDRLGRLHAQRKHALILGPAGVGKSSLVNHLKHSLGLLVSLQSERLVSICESLEVGLNLDRQIHEVFPLSCPSSFQVKGGT